MMCNSKEGKIPITFLVSICTITCTKQKLKMRIKANTQTITYLLFLLKYQWIAQIIVCWCFYPSIKPKRHIDKPRNKSRFLTNNKRSVKGFRIFSAVFVPLNGERQYFQISSLHIKGSLWCPLWNSMSNNNPSLPSSMESPF